MPFCRGLPSHLDKVVAWGTYDHLLREVVLRMKHRGSEPLSRAMARLFTADIHEAAAALQASVVIPVPMHWRRRWVRGTNSPEILAGALAQALGIQVDCRGVIRRRSTPEQTALSPRERSMNVRDAFDVRKSASYKGARVLLVDDVLTTGATCGEIAKLLKQAGAVSVWAAVLARTPGGASG